MCVYVESEEERKEDVQAYRELCDVLWYLCIMGYKGNW